MKTKSSFATVGRSLGAVALGICLLIQAGMLMYGAHIDEPYGTLLAIAITGVAFGLGIGLIAVQGAGILAALFSALVIVLMISDLSQGYLVSILAILVSGLAPLTAESLSRCLRGRSSRSSYPVESRKPENSETREIEN